MKYIKILFLSSLIYSSANAFEYEAFDLDKFKAKKNIYQGTHKSKMEEKYGRDINYKSYAERAKEKNAPSAIIGIGRETRNTLTTTREYLYTKDTVPRETNVLSKETTKKETTSKNNIWMSSLMKLSYFNIQEDIRNTYLAVTLGNYIDVEVLKDLTNGRHSDIYFMPGIYLRYDSSKVDTAEGGISFGGMLSVGFTFYKNWSIFWNLKTGTQKLYDSKYTTKISEDKYEQAFYLTLRF